MISYPPLNLKIIFIFKIDINLIYKEFFGLWNSFKYPEYYLLVI